MVNFLPRSAELTTMVYPTELEEKVKNIFTYLIGDYFSFREERITSHYGYSFKVLTVKLDGKKAASLLKKVICKMDELDFLKFIDRLGNYVDGRNLYIRLKKQDIILGRFGLYEGESGGYIRIKVTFKRPDLQAIREYIRNMRELECT
ncbi:MAG: hypothetical protein J7J65_03840 [Candidatus Korarchaeota archaeon]|nr:hypothetical protein [Candidatus Korarchaeota archaeon]